MTSQAAPEVQRAETIDESHRSKRRRRRRPASPYIGPLTLWTPLDLLAELAVLAIFLFGLGNYGYVQKDSLWNVTIVLCVLLGLYGAARLATGALLGGKYRGLRRGLLVLGVALAWFGFQLIPLPAGLTSSLSPVWRETLMALGQAGLPVPDAVPLAHYPSKAFRSWTQLAIQGAFFLGVCGLVSGGGRASAFRLAAMVAGLSLLEGIWGLLRFFSADASLAYGALFNPNHHALLSLLGLPLWLGILSVLKETNRSFSGPILSGSNPLLLLHAAGACAFLGAIASFSRGALVDGTIVLCWIGWELTRRGGERFIEPGENPFRMPLTVRRVALTLVVMFALLSLFPLSFLIDGFRGQSWESDAAGTGRLGLWRATFTALGESPLTGLGLGGTERALTRLAETATNKTAVYSHGDYFQWLAESGVPAFLTLVLGAFWALWGWLKSGLPLYGKTTRDYQVLERGVLIALAVCLLHAAFDFHLRIPLVGFAFLVVLAIGLSHAFLTPRPGNQAHH
ncbi:MAG: O-antigen ligase family protein [Sumerlaeia bacterium]